jgi:hypothetical protein
MPSVHGVTAADLRRGSRHRPGPAAHFDLDGITDTQDAACLTLDTRVLAKGHTEHVLVEPELPEHR